MVKKYSNFILEKMGINKDVVAVSELIYNKIQSLPNKTGKIIIKKNEIPKTSHNISEIVVKLDDSTSSYFDKTFSKPGRYGYKLIFNVKPSEYDVKGVTHHEINHGFDWMIAKEKGTKDYFFDWHKISDMKNDPAYATKTMTNIERFLYMCYPTEIKSRLHDFYSRLKDGIKDIKNPTYEDLSKITKQMEIKGTTIWVSYKKMMEFDIFKEMYRVQKMEDITKNKKGMAEILKRYGMQYNNENLKKLQNFVNDRGLYYRNKLHKIISLVLEEKEKMFEQINDYDYDEEDDETENLADPNVNVKIGDKVICIKDCFNFHAYDDHPNVRILIKKGDIKTVANGTILNRDLYKDRKKYKDCVFFTDTPEGSGVYPAENFEKI